MDNNEKSKIVSDKKYTTAVIISGIFGVIGIHHFYVERWAVGFFDLGLFIATMYFYFTDQFVIAGILFTVDLIHTIIVTYLLLVGQYRDGEGKLIIYPGQKI